MLIKILDVVTHKESQIFDVVTSKESQILDAVIRKASTVSSIIKCLCKKGEQDEMKIIVE